MNEGEIRMQAKMYSLVAKMFSVNAGVEGMKAINTTRESQGYALAYDESAFIDAQTELETISQRLQDEI